MGTNYKERLRRWGRPLPPTRGERAAPPIQPLEALLRAWSQASMRDRAEFMNHVGLRPATQPEAPSRVES